MCESPSASAGEVEARSAEGEGLPPHAPPNRFIHRQAAPRSPYPPNTRPIRTTPAPTARRMHRIDTASFYNPTASVSSPATGALRASSC
jgi:hypothetical protein